MRRAEGGKAAGGGAVSQPGPGGARTPAAQLGLRVRRETGSGGHGRLRCKWAAARCKHGPGGGAGVSVPGALGRGERCRWGDPCEGGPRQQPAVSTPASPERSGVLRGPNGGGGGSGYLLPGEASLGPGELVGRRGGGGARASGVRAGAGGCLRRGGESRCKALLSSVPPRAFVRPGPERFGAKQMYARGGGSSLLPCRPLGVSAAGSRSRRRDSGTTPTSPPTCSV